ncbi:MAG: DUF59 domain-containing protein, partial [Chloroflexi bacterium]
MKKISKAGGEAKSELQRNVDWMFPLTVEWFGLPDNLKMHSTQLEYRLKGKTNDELRQWWLSVVVPFCESIGVKVPAHREGDAYVLDFPFPSTFDAENKHWDFNDPCSWDDVLERWRARGPRNAEMVAETGSLEERCWAALAEVQDPEMPISLVDLGLIYKLEVEEGLVKVELTFTAMGCPAYEMILEDVRARLLAEPGIEHVLVKVVWDPPWSSERLTPEGREALEMWGLAV